MQRTWLVCAAAVGIVFHAPRPLDAQPAAGCSDAVHREFDFWIGEWEVRRADGTVAGRNTIRAIADGCGLAESWRGASGTVGESLNHYDAADGRWHQRWIDSSGLILELAGGPAAGGMRLEGRDRDGVRLHRITWTPLEDGRVRQRWQASADGGAVWQDVFDGYYVKR